MNEMKELISKLKEADHAYYDLDEPIAIHIISPSCKN